MYANLWMCITKIINLSEMQFSYILQDYHIFKSLIRSLITNAKIMKNEIIFAFNIFSLNSQ